MAVVFSFHRFAQSLEFNDITSLVFMSHMLMLSLCVYIDDPCSCTKHEKPRKEISRILVLLECNF